MIFLQRVRSLFKRASSGRVSYGEVPTPRRDIQCTPNSSRTLSFDVQGLVFTAKIMLALSVLITGWSLVTPDVDSFAQGDGATDTQEHASGGVDESTDAEEFTIAQLLDSDSASESSVRYVPKEGPFVFVDLVDMKLSLFENGGKVSEFPILRAASGATALAEGEYEVNDRTDAEVSTLAMVRFPHYVRFGGSYAMHGVPTQVTGEPFDGERVDGSVTLADADAEAVFAFAAMGTPVAVRTDTATLPFKAYTKLVVKGTAIPATSARSYAVAELSRGQVLLEKKSGTSRPIASITKLFTALVASELIKEGEAISVGNGESYTLGDLYYPLLLRSDNSVAASMASHIGTSDFMAAMNEYVQSLGMPMTSFADSSGLSPKNVSTAYDLTTFARHLYLERGDILATSKEARATIKSVSGMKWNMTNQNKLASDPYFVGGKLGFTDEAAQTALSIFALPVDGQTHVIAVVVLGSQDWKQDTRTLLRWLLENVRHGEE